MAPPVVGKRYRVRGWRKGRFVGTCVSAARESWQFKLESQVEGLISGWVIGEVVPVGVSSVGALQEVPFDVVR